MAPIELPIEEENQNAMSIDIYHPEKGMEIEMDDCWEDDDQRLFYTDFPDLKSIVPMVAWKDSEKVRGGKFKKRDDKEKREYTFTLWRILGKFKNSEDFLINIKIF